MFLCLVFARTGGFEPVDVFKESLPFLWAGFQEALTSQISKQRKTSKTLFKSCVRSMTQKSMYAKNAAWQNENLSSIPLFSTELDETMLCLWK